MNFGRTWMRFGNVTLANF